MGQRGFCGGTLGAVINIVIFYSVLLVINRLISIPVQLRLIIEIIIYITLLFINYLPPLTFMHIWALLLYVIIHNLVKRTDRNHFSYQSKFNIHVSIENMLGHGRSMQLPCFIFSRQYFQSIGF